MSELLFDLALAGTIDPRMNPFPEQYELIGLFECEPVLADADIPWEYNSLRFDTMRGVNRLVCEIAPGYEVVRLEWTRDGVEMVHLEMNGVHGLIVETVGDRETLIGTFLEPAIDEFRLQLRPSVHLRWGTAIQP